MKLLINAATLRGYGSGAVGRNVLTELARIEQGPHCTAWIPSAWGWRKDQLGERMKLHPTRPGFVGKLVAENISIRGALLRGEGDRLFSMGDTSLPLCTVPHLLLIHIPYLAYSKPEWGFEVPASFAAKLKLIETSFRATLPTVTAITVQTEHMKKRIASRWNYSEQKIHVVPSSIEPVEFERNAYFYRSQKKQQPYICYVASASPHKNHTVLAEMMAVLKSKGFDTPCRLTVRREEVPSLVERARQLRVLSLFEFCGGLPPQQALEMMAGAVVMVMPSRLETFGLPFFEAMQLGCPLVISDLEFAREACADSALYAAADSGEDFAEKVAQVLQSHSFGKTLSAAGRKRFTRIYRPWSAIAGRYLKLLEELG
jgi:glycosyltransferase involved in cell wall biosynthesis